MNDVLVIVFTGRSGYSASTYQDILHECLINVRYTLRTTPPLDVKAGNQDDIYFEEYSSVGCKG